MLILILLPSGSRASVICHYSNFGFTSVLFADGPTSSRRTGRTQTAPSQKPLCIYACAEPKPINLARGWVSCLRLRAAWICPPCIWIRAGPRPPSPARCENTFLSVDKRSSEMMSNLFKECGLWTLTVFPVSIYVFEAYVALGATGFWFFKLLRCFQTYLSKITVLSANHEIKHPVVLLSRLKVCFGGW